LTLFSPAPDRGALGERGTWPRSLGRRRWRRDRLATPYLFLLPGFALYAVVLLYPIARAFEISLYDWKILPGAVSDFIGLENYTRALHDPVFWRALVNSSVYMAVTVPAQIALGLFAAVLLDARLPGRALFRVLFYLPVITSWVVVSLLFQYLFSSDTGVANWFLQDLHVVDHNVNWLQQRWTAMAVLSLLGIWKGIGWSMVIFLAALQGVPRELHEAAAIDGAGAWGRFRHVSLPGIRRTMLFVLVMLVIGGFNVFISVFLITGGGPADETQVLLTYMYRQAFDFLDFGYGAALAFMLTTIVLALSGLQMRIFRSEPEGA
jgi:multiple sugar transport system permease protein